MAQVWQLQVMKQLVALQVVELQARVWKLQVVELQATVEALVALMVSGWAPQTFQQRQKTSEATPSGPSAGTEPG